MAYYTHPDLGDNNKSLRVFYLYTGTNPNRVLTAEYANVVNWTFDDELAGDLTLTIGSITSPAVDAAAGTDVCSVSFSDSGPNVGTYSLALSGTNASLYQLNNTTQSQTGSTITNVLTTDTNKESILPLQQIQTIMNLLYLHRQPHQAQLLTFKLTEQKNHYSQV